MDIVGPLPKTRSGNKYVLTICDATKYPEAIPLPSIEAERIAKELMIVFSRMGIPKEILTDQGTNFMSTLLHEVYQLLNDTRILTGLHLGLSSRGAIATIAKLRGSMGIACHIHFIHCCNNPIIKFLIETVQCINSATMS